MNDCLNDCRCLFDGHGLDHDCGRVVVVGILRLRDASTVGMSSISTSIASGGIWVYLSRSRLCKTVLKRVNSLSRLRWCMVVVVVVARGDPKLDGDEEDEEEKVSVNECLLEERRHEV